MKLSINNNANENTRFMEVKTGQPSKRIANSEMAGKENQERGAFDSDTGSCSQNTPLRGMGHQRNLLLWLATRNNLCWGRERSGRVWDAFLKNMDTPACRGEVGLPRVWAWLCRRVQSSKSKPPLRPGCFLDASPGLRGDSECDWLWDFKHFWVIPTDLDKGN